MWYSVAFIALIAILALRSRLLRHIYLLTKAQNAFTAKQWPEAERLYRAALNCAPGGPESNYHRGCQIQLARIRYRRGDLLEAEAFLQRSLPGWAQDSPGVLDALSIGYVTWGQVCLDQGRYLEAQGHLVRALRLRERTGNDALMIMELQTLGEILLRQEKFDEAESILQRSNEIEGKVVHQVLSREGTNPSSRVVVSMTQPDVYFSQRRWAEALNVYQEKVVHWERSLTRPDNVDLGHLQMRLAEVQTRLDDQPAAIETYRHAAASLVKDWGEDHPRVAFALSRLSQSLNNANERTEACRLAQQALDLFESHGAPEHPEADCCRQVLVRSAI